jgi:ketosteroid isomerase-like protein
VQANVHLAVSTGNARKGEWNMTRTAMSRRYLLAAGAGALAGAAGASGVVSAHAWIGRGTTNQEIIRKYYAAWEKKDWGPMDILLADDFTFMSAAQDSPFGKSVFKAQCWDSQIDFIERFDLEQVIANGNEAFVKYLGHTKNGKSFRNVEHLRFRGEKVEALYCYFGQKSSFPSAVSAG